MTIFEMALYSRFKPLRGFAYRRVRPGDIFAPSPHATRVLLGGDMSFDPELRYPPGVYREKRSDGRSKSALRKLKKKATGLLFSPALFSGKLDFDFGALRLKSLEKGNEWTSKVYRNCLKHDFEMNGNYSYPFEKIGPFIRTKDIVFANLENPLTSTRRAHGFFLADPGYAGAMKEAGINIVSVANNHIFDGGEVGFLHTMENLNINNIEFTGGGKDLSSARRGRIVRANGTSILFLAYTRFCNSNFASAAGEYPGILPLDIDLIMEDLKSARGKSDLVFISLHWGYENQPGVHPMQVEIAHKLIEAGADCIIGHHSHVPHGIEVYKGRPVIYSLGNFIFGYYMEGWQDNILAELVIEDKRIGGLIIHPISGRRNELIQPELLMGPRADSLLDEIRIKSAVFGTKIGMKDGAGYVRIG